MRRNAVLLTMIVLLLAGGCGKKAENKASGELKGAITVSGAFALYPVAVKWGEEYSKLHPNVHVDISAGGAGKGMADVLGGLVDIGMVSREIQPVEVSKGAWSLAVAKDGVVVVANEKNPLIQKLRKSGVSLEKLHRVWLQGNGISWEELAGMNKGGSAVHVYTRSDSCGAAETLAQFLGRKQEDMKGIGVFGDPGLAEAVKKDELGIGYNNINFAYDPTTRRPIEGLAVLPLDRNNNGRIDAGEEFYADRDMLVAAVSDGRYPSPPARDLYFVCRGQPQKEPLKSFLIWVLTEGQKLVTEAGYVSPAPEKIKAGLEKLK